MGSATTFGRAVLDLAVDRMRVSAMQVEAMRVNSYLDPGPPALQDIAQRALLPSRPHGDMADGGRRNRTYVANAHTLLRNVCRSGSRSLSPSESLDGEPA